jgi:CHAT domain-containing protein/tetratricopeptide (TPR) repeat protein
VAQRPHRRLAFPYEPLVVVAIVGVIAVVMSRGPVTTPSQAALPSLLSWSSNARPIEPRVSATRGWAPFRPQAPTADKEGDGARGRPAISLHVAAVVALLRGDSRQALEALNRQSTSSNDPAVWSDLSAAYYQTAVQYDAPAFLTSALAAADHALALNAELGAPLFNRALVLERLGLRSQAREAWQRFLAVESVGGWADEGRAHLGALAPVRPFLEVVDADYERAATNPAFVAGLAANDPFGARSAGVMEVLGRWGEAVLRNDTHAADRHFRVAANLGHAIARLNGDRLLAEAVAAIERRPDARPRLAGAHTQYLRGMTAVQSARPGEAEPILREAAATFAQANSPVALLAEHFSIITFSAQGRRGESGRLCQALLKRVGPEFPSLRALILSQLGVSRESRAEWGAAIEAIEESASIFARLGETKNVATQHRLLAFLYDRIDDRESAWRHRLAALHGLGGQRSLVLVKTVSSIVEAAILRSEWREALSFVTLQLEIARHIADDVQVADALLTRSILRERLSDNEGARSDGAEARAVAAGVRDAFYRRYLHVAGLRASAMRASTSPLHALAMLDEAVDFQATQSDRVNLPGLLLQRARARRRIGDLAGAVADVERGIFELERQRGSLPQGEARWGAFHGAAGLFDEGMELALETGDVDHAFRFTERSRARALIESYGATAEFDVRRLPLDIGVVSYTCLESRLVIFVATSSGVRAFPVPIRRDTLARDTEVLIRAVAENDSVNATRAGQIVYRHLFAPIEAALSAVSTIVIVPDATTSAIPFAALRHPKGELLLQKYAIVVASGAAVFAVAAERRAALTAKPSHAVVLSSSPPAGDPMALVFVEAEARRIAELYRSSSRIPEDAAQFDELSRLAPEADVLHFGGHAVGDDRGFEAASITLRQDGSERRVGPSEIAKLRLRRNATVVLAGCSTGRGVRRAAEGVVSVAYGFLSAGAPSVIATLWPINDKDAAIFFPRLHRRLTEGMRPAEALREAQRESIQRGDVPMSLWAAVENFGS